MKNLKPTVLDYSDYKEFLNAVYQYNKSLNRSFSHRYISNKVGASSAGWFSNVVSGRISLTGTHFHKLCELLELSANETDYFELLVKYEQSASIEEKELCFRKIAGVKGVNSKIISKESFELYSYWYISAVRELLFIYDFKDDYSALAKLVRPQIKHSQAKKAIKVLVKLNMVKKDLRGFLKPVDTIITKADTFNTVHWANQIRAKSQLAVEAVESFSKEERDLSEVYMPLSEEGFKEARKEIAALRKKLLAISEKEKNQNRIYQCNFQLFPLSAHIEENNNELLY